ncbi:MAG: DUF4388 domain-containing protein [Desulforhopalus sp.]
MQFRNGVFVVTEEDHCPLYNVREELSVSEGALTLPAGKPTCLTLAKDVVEIASADTSYEKYTQGTSQKAKFECGGCTGIIRFEYKKDRGFATLQMKLLAAAERRDKVKEVGEIARLLRSIEVFSSLTKDDLIDLAALLELVDYPWQFPITLKGDPGNRLFILLSGKAEVTDDHGVILAELKTGEVFGEMSLLSGERVSNTILAADPCRVGVLNQKNFRHALNRFPALQILFYKLLAGRINKVNQQRAEELASGMVGQLSDISAVELCQMINANQKTGRLNIESDEIRAAILFYEGEIVDAKYNTLHGKEAFFKVFSIHNGRFKFIQGLTSKEKTLDVVGGFMGMLMEGMRRLDDQEQ